MSDNDEATRKGVTGSLPPAYFETLYAETIDPWSFETSEYEAEKYATTVRSLPRARYANALEIGCSIGVLTEKLASRCDHLLSVDVSELALERARKRCAALPWVAFRRSQVPREMPQGSFDLVLVSEVGYYLGLDDLEKTIVLLADRQPVGANLVLVHFLPPVEDYPLTGDQVHEVWLAHPQWKRLNAERRERYRVDVLERVDC